ncbi:agmatine deiminase family protein [Thiothrix eikelboomii]|uniref:agmatine deiminase family protein n=1 Tax=Thiothrix eikelboomii TaxID=92487 RepID=UPI003BAE1C7D
MHTLSRRQFLQLSLVSGLGFGWPASDLSAATTDADTPSFILPAEYAKHHATWMAYGVSPRFYPQQFPPTVRKNLALIAQTIAKYEPVSLLVRPKELAPAKELFGAVIHYIERPLDNLWLRDSAPSLLLNPAGQMRAIDFHFKGWGSPQTHTRDAKLAQFIAQHLQLELIEADLQLAASNLEVDGAGTAILTESSVFYAGRNAQLTKRQIENRLRRLVGIKKCIWLPGDPQGELAQRATDYYARFVQVGSVLVSHEPNPDFREHAITRKHQAILQAATDAQGQRLKLVSVAKPPSVRSEFVTPNFAASYLGFYVCNAAVLLPEFGDPRTDNAARQALSQAFPERKIELLNIDALASGGASIHSVTRQQPSL